MVSPRSTAPHRARVQSRTVVCLPDPCGRLTPSAVLPAPSSSLSGFLAQSCRPLCRTRQLRVVATAQRCASFFSYRTLSLSLDGWITTAHTLRSGPGAILCNWIYPARSLFCDLSRLVPALVPLRAIRPLRRLRRSLDHSSVCVCADSGQ